MFQSTKLDCQNADCSSNRSTFEQNLHEHVNYHRPKLAEYRLYYAVQIRDMMVWVSSDDELQHRLRALTSKSGFKELIAILSKPGEPLPDDRQQRRARLLVLLRDGSTQSLCHIIRGLHAYQKIRSLNVSDQSILKQARSSLMGEWGFVLSMTPAQAEHELHHWLALEQLDIA